MPKPRQYRKFVNSIISERVVERSSTATIEVVDGNLADIRLTGHTTYYKFCRIVGDPNELVIGMTVGIRWEENNGTMRPVVMAPGGGSGGENSVIVRGGGSGVEVDNVTIENATGGLRVKDKGISLRHLDFVPALYDHNHAINDFLPGWNVSNDGILFTDQVSINPLGTITFGRDPDIVKMGVEDATYRIWAGASNPASALFSVSKTGHLISTSATIAGWTISATQIKKTGIILDSSTDQIIVGSASPQIIIDGGSKIIKSSNFTSGQSGFGLYATDGNAEFNNVVVRGTLRASVFNIGEMTATAGSSGVWKSASEIYASKTTPANGASGTIDVKNSDANPTVKVFSTGDILRVKAWNGSAIIDWWAKITSYAQHTGYTTYTVTTESGGAVAIKKGMAIVDYGTTDTGHIIQSADGTVGASANMTIGLIKYGEVNAVSVYNGGGGYAVNDILTLTGGNNGCTVKVTALVPATTQISTVSLQTAGTDYVNGNYSTTGGGGTGAVITVTDYLGPWDGIYTRLRLGNMYGSYGTGANNRYGFGIGDYDAGNYLSYNAEAADKFILKAAGGGIELSENGLIITNFTSTLDDVGSVIFKDSAAGEIGRTYAWFGGTTSYVGLVGGRSSWNAYSIVEVNALNNGTYQANAMLTAQAGGAGPRAGVYVYDNGSNGWVVLDGTTYGIKANQGVTADGILRTEGSALANGAANGGVEIAWYSTYGRVLSYNRTTASDQPLYLRGSEVRLREAGTDIAIVDGGDFYRYPFQNYASTTVGWSSTTTKKVYVKDFGKWVFVQFEIYGTSNAGGSTKTFSLPYNNNSSIQAEAVHRNVNGFGMTILPVSSNIVALYRDPAITAWQSSGTVWANGQFWYQRA